MILAFLKLLLGIKPKKEQDKMIDRSKSLSQSVKKKMLEDFIEKG